ncbi:MgtC/SapB family protein [Microbacterium sp. NPDC058345]|uniref:MgtC/SapB family protein n=1 Tax=Microbacterium sp. NPDC058345 TaxID=3346455 RepID=UPI00364FC42E
MELDEWGGAVVQIQWVTPTTLTESALLVLAFVLSAVIGIERHRKLKSAGIRTHTLVGVGSAVFTLVSAYGFQGVVGPDTLVDPSRIAAQIVSGIGFLGAGVIFVRQNAVSGLTTAASIWLTAAIGMACGAGAPILALLATGLHLLTVTLLGRLGIFVRRAPHNATFIIRYREGNGALRNTLSTASQAGFEALVTETKDISKPGKSPRFQAAISLRSRSGVSPSELLGSIADVPGVLSVEIERDDND